MNYQFNLNYSLVGKHHVVGKDHDLLLLTIISMINELGGETLSLYLSLCSMEAICSKKYALSTSNHIRLYDDLVNVELLLRLC